jgi:hypothetical protein
MYKGIGEPTPKPVTKTVTSSSVDGIGTSVDPIMDVVES